MSPLWGSASAVFQWATKRRPAGRILLLLGTASPHPPQLCVPGWGPGLGKVRHACAVEHQGGTWQWLSLPQASSITTHSVTRKRWASYWPGFFPQWGSPVCCGLGWGKRSAGLDFLAPVPSGSALCGHLTAGGPHGAPWVRVRVYTFPASISVLKWRWH